MKVIARLRTSLPKLNAKVQRQTQVLCHARVLVRQVLLTYMPFDVRLHLFRNVLSDCSSRRSRRDCAQDPIVVARLSGFALGYPLASLGPHCVRRLPRHSIFIRFCWRCICAGDNRS